MDMPAIAIYGIGRFGGALAQALADAGSPPITGGRETGPAAFIAALREPSLVVIAVRDAGIAEVAAKMAGAEGAGKHGYVHVAGGADLRPLAALAAVGARVGQFHILQSFPPSGGAARIAGSFAVIDAPAELNAMLRELAARLKVTPVNMPEGAQRRYHAAGTLASNALTTLLDASARLLESAGFAREHASRMLLPLVRGSLENLEALNDPGAALSGPVARGDLVTVREHLGALDGETRELYRALLLGTVGLALRAGRIDEATAREFRAL